MPLPAITLVQSTSTGGWFRVTPRPGHHPGPEYIYRVCFRVTPQPGYHPGPGYIYRGVFQSYPMPQPSPLSRVHLPGCVSELPHAPAITLVQLSAESNRAADVEWEPGFDGNSPIISFVVQFRRVPEGTPLEYVPYLVADGQSLTYHSQLFR